MDYVPDIKKVIVDLADRAIVVRDVMEHMRVIEDVRAYGEWAIRWTVLTDVLSMLTGRDTTECLTKQDFENIIKTYGEMA